MFTTLMSAALFLVTAAGHYSGQGTSHQFTNTGAIDTTYDIDFQINALDENTVTLDAKVDASGALHSDHVQLAMRDGKLFYSTNTLNGTPVAVLESTDHSLSYKMNVVNFNDGNIYEITTSYVLKDNKIDVHTTSTTNGIQIYNDEFNAQGF